MLTKSAVQEVERDIKLRTMYAYRAVSAEFAIDRHGLPVLRLKVPQPPCGQVQTVEVHEAALQLAGHSEALAFDVIVRNLNKQARKGSNVA